VRDQAEPFQRATSVPPKAQTSSPGAFLTTCQAGAACDAACHERR
jgi:hypothetical protein